jgi:hypothetical protein
MNGGLQVSRDMDDNPYIPPATDPELGTVSPCSRWFRAPYRLPIIHTVLILASMLALLAGWTDFSPFPFDCVYPPYFFLSGPIVHAASHVAQHSFDRCLSPGDVHSIRLAWNLIPGSVCLVLGGVQWWLIEVVYLRIRRRASGTTVTAQV